MKKTLVLTVNSEFALSYEELVIAAMKLDWYRRPDDTKESTRRKFLESLTDELRSHGEDFFHHEPFSERVNTGRATFTEFHVDPTEWLDQPDDYQTLMAAIELINEIF